MAIGASNYAAIPFNTRTGMQASQPSWTSPSNSAIGAYGAAVNQNAADYDKIQGRYDTLFGQSQSNQNRAPIPFSPLTAQTQKFNATPQYQQSGRLNEVANSLSGMSSTGGYSEGDINSFRARGLAPIRSIYAGAQENLRRNKSLQGGYSPNYGAMQAKLAREQSSIIGQHTNDLNAGIAERVAQGRQFGLSNLAPIAQRESELQHGVNAENAAGTNRVNELNAAEQSRVNELNAQMRLQIEGMNRAGSNDAISQGLQANAGAANLYGTTPALTNTFGNQLLQSNQQNLAGQQATASIRQNRAGTGVNLLGMGAQPTYNYSGYTAGRG